MNRNQKYGFIILAFLVLFIIFLSYYFYQPEQKYLFIKNKNNVAAGKQIFKTKSGTYNDPVITNDEVFTVVEQMPEFPGGEEKLYEYLNQNMNYPRHAKEQGIQGKVLLTFTVDKFGNINEVEVIKGIGGGCDEEAMRVIANMPRWDPGKQNGKPVNVKFRFPINFTLR